VTGDLLTQGRRGASEAIGFLKGLAALGPTYVVPGNKDYRESAAANPRETEHSAVDDWAATGVTLLRNAAVAVDIGGSRVCVAGVDDSYSKRQDLRAALAGIPAKEPILLLSHTPEVIRHPAINRVIAIFSGHTHGGQICLRGGRALFTNTRLPKRLASGVHDVSDTRLVVSRGAGATRIRIRVNCPPEMTVWRLVGRLRDEG
jgi:predicted MPP superfamily phosphohydrolase